MKKFILMRYLIIFTIMSLSALLTSCSRYNQTLAPVVYGEQITEDNKQEKYKRDGFIQVLAGDTLESIAKKYNVSLPDLIKINQIQSPFIIRPGEYLKLPENNYYIVKKGDSLTSISRCLNVNMNSIIIFNNLEQPYRLFPGQVLYFNNNLKKDNCNVEQESKVIKITEPTKSSQNIIKKMYSWPTEGKVISTFGPKDGGKINDGINILAAEGAPVRATRSGTVVYTGNEIPAYGTLVIIRHSDGWTSAYAHLSKILVSKGDIINRNNVIATVGKTGNVLSPQLHFEIRHKSKPVNPLKFLQQR